MSLKARLASLQAQIKEICWKSNCSISKIKPIWVTKTISVEVIKELFNLGEKRIGENKAQELKQKISQLNEFQFECHFLGNLQSNKIKTVIPYIDYLHSLSSISLAEKIDKFIGEREVVNPLKVLVQVNISNEESKRGIKVEEAIPFFKQLFKYHNLEVVGLMTMAPFTDDSEIIRDCFKGLKRLSQSLQKKFSSHLSLTELSMGMSNDYKIALEEGATFIRLGRSLFGNRNYPN